MQIFIINLDSATDRRTFQEKQCAKHNLTPTFVSACTGDDIIANGQYDHHRLSWQRPMKATEIACYFSHRKIWEKVAAADAPCLILEDDAVFCAEFAPLLQKIIDVPDYDIINLETTGRKKYIASKSVALNHHFSLHRLYLDRSGAGGYLLSPAGAKKLLAHQNKYGIALADAFIHSCYRLRSFQINSAAIIQLEIFSAFGMSPPIETKSSLFTPEKDLPQKKYLRCKIHRCMAQVRLGFRLCRILFIAKRSTIAVESHLFPQGKQL